MHQKKKNWFDNLFLVSELKTHIRKLDHETSDLKFLNNQYVHKVRCLEKDGKAKAERIQQLQEKNMQAVVQTPGNVRGHASKYHFTIPQKSCFSSHTLSQVERSAASLSDVRGCRSMSSSLPPPRQLTPCRSRTIRMSLTCCSWQMEGLFSFATADLYY